MTDYEYLRAWGSYMGSQPHYISDQVKRAQETKAPPTAIYEKHDSEGRTGEWETFEDITNPLAKHYVETRVEAMRRTQGGK